MKEFVHSSPEVPHWDVIDDYLEALGQVKKLAGNLNISDKAAAGFDGLRDFHEITKQGRFGTLNEVIEHLKESFLSNHEDIPLPPDCKIQIGLIPDERPANKYLVVMWRIQGSKRGSLNVPHIFLRRGDSQFELRIP